MSIKNRPMLRPVFFCVIPLGLSGIGSAVHRRGAESDAWGGDALAGHIGGKQLHGLRCVAMMVQFHDNRRSGGGKSLCGCGVGPRRRLGVIPAVQGGVPQPLTGAREGIALRLR